MKIDVKKFISAFLSVMLLLSLGVTAFAANTDLNATLDCADSKIEVSDQVQTIKMSITTAAELNCCGIGFTASVPSPLKIVGFECTDSDVTFTEGNYSLDTGKLTWYTSDTENIKTRDLGTIIVEVPANTEAGSYTLSVTNVKVVTDYGATDLIKNGTVSATLTIVAPVILYNVTVDDGTLANGKMTDKFAEGADVTITADSAPEGKEFDTWTVIAGPDGFAIPDATSSTTTFEMPAGDVTVKATYKTHTTHSFSSAWYNDADSHYHVCVCGAQSDKAAHTYGDWKSNGYSSHSRSCSVCGGGKETASHSYGSDNTCVDCGYVTSGGSTGNNQFGQIYLPRFYTLKFDVNGGSAVKTLTRVQGSVIDLNKYVSARNGYIFDGWYSDAALTKEITSVKLTKNTTVYAGWTEVSADSAEDTAAETVAKLPFADVSENDWFYEDVLFVYENGLMIGTDLTKFSPEMTLNRATIVTTLWRLSGSPAADTAVTFADLPDGEWYTDAMKWAIANEIILGYGDNTCRPLAEITHEQVCAVFQRYLTLLGADVNVPGWTFTKAAYSEWAEEYVLWAEDNDLFDGFGSDVSDLTKTANRSEIAAYLHRLCDRIAE